MKAPAQFATRQIGKTPVTRTTGTSMVIFFFNYQIVFIFNQNQIKKKKEIASDGLKGRVFETSLGDLNNNEDAFRKFRLIIEDTQGKTCLTNFHGMDITTDKLRSMIRKKQVNYF